MFGYWSLFTLSKQHCVGMHYSNRNLLSMHCHHWINVKTLFKDGQDQKCFDFLGGEKANYFCFLTTVMVILAFVLGCWVSPKLPIIAGEYTEHQRESSQVLLSLVLSNKSHLTQNLNFEHSPSPTLHHTDWSYWYMREKEQR